MTAAYSLDACRDAGALLSATADRDRQGAEVILTYADNREVAEVLAILLTAACRDRGPGFLADLCHELRTVSENRGE